MQPEQSHTMGDASVGSLDELCRPLRSDEMAKLWGNDVTVSLPGALGNDWTKEISEELLTQLVYFLIWKKMEMDFLDEHSGIVSQFERTLDGYSNSFDKAFK